MPWEPGSEKVVGKSVAWFLALVHSHNTMTLSPTRSHGGRSAMHKYPAESNPPRGLLLPREQKPSEIKRGIKAAVQTGKAGVRSRRTPGRNRSDLAWDGRHTHNSGHIFFLGLPTGPARSFSP